MQERVLHALDLGMLGDWDGAKHALERVDDPLVPRLMALFTEQQRRERERAEIQAVVRHELGNAISIAQANMEALLDGVLQPTPERLAGIRDALVTCGQLLDDLKKQSRSFRDSHVRVAMFDVCDIIASQLQMVQGMAEAKNVTLHYETCRKHFELRTQYRGDPDRVALILRDVLLGAVRYTPPGGAITMTCVKPDGEVELSITNSPGARAHEEIGFSLVSKLLDAIGGQAHIVTERPGNTTFVLRLPAIPVVAVSS